jgi:hypothetical protein
MTLQYFIEVRCAFPFITIAMSYIGFVVELQWLVSERNSKTIVTVTSSLTCITAAHDTTLMVLQQVIS